MSWLVRITEVKSTDGNPSLEFIGLQRCELSVPVFVYRTSRLNFKGAGINIGKSIVEMRETIRVDVIWSNLVAEPIFDVPGLVVCNFPPRRTLLIFRTSLLWNYLAATETLLTRTVLPFGICVDAVIFLGLTLICQCLIDMKVQTNSLHTSHNKSSIDSSHTSCFPP
jgi:hypothetical protein